MPTVDGDCNDVVVAPVDDVGIGAGAGAGAGAGVDVSGGDAGEGSLPEEGEEMTWRRRLRSPLDNSI